MKDNLNKIQDDLKELNNKLWGMVPTILYKDDVNEQEKEFNRWEEIENIKGQLLNNETLTRYHEQRTSIPREALVLNQETREKEMIEKFQSKIKEIMEREG